MTFCPNLQKLFISVKFDVVVVLIISQLLSKTCNVILSAPRSWRQVCAIRNLRKSLRLLTKVWIAQTCLHDLGADKMTLQVLLRAEKWWVQQQHQTDNQYHYMTWKSNKFGWNEQFLKIWTKYWTIPFTTAYLQPPSPFYAVIY